MLSDSATIAARAAVIAPTLRPYQLDGIQYLVSRTRCCLVDEPGLGKTVQILVSLQLCNMFPVLICAPRSALGVWRDEIAEWLGSDAATRTVLYGGTSQQRQKLRMSGALQNAQFVITSYRIGAELLSYTTATDMEQNLLPLWRALVCDEFHRVGLLNIKTATYKVFKTACARVGTQKWPAVRFYGVSGTPYTKGPQDFFGLLHLFEPKNAEFRSYWRFVETHCRVFENNAGYKEIHPCPKHPENFRRLLSNYFLRRTKEAVLPQLPAKIRQIIPIEMSSRQAKLYKSLGQDLVVQLQQNTVFALSPLTLAVRLRQMLVSPQCLDAAEKDIGGGIEALLEMVDLDFDAGNSVLVFTPFVRGVELVAKTLKEKLNAAVFMIHGQMKGGVLPSDTALAFQNAPGRRKVLVCTIKTGQAWTATAANVVYFLGYEWAAVENEQAEDRAHRLGQQKSVVCKYIKYTNTIDQDVLQAVLNKELGFAASLDAARFRRIIQARFIRKEA